MNSNEQNALENALTHDFSDKISDLARAAGITAELARTLSWSCESSAIRTARSSSPGPTCRSAPSR